MLVTDFARAYVEERGIEKTPVYSANRFARMMGDRSIDEVDEAALAQWKKLSEAANLKIWTIKGGLKDLRTLIRARGSDVKIAKIKPPEPNPQPVDLEILDKLWPHLADWSRQWLVIAYWTALRFADTVRMQRVVDGKKLEWRANKTGHRHRWPVMEWLPPHLAPVKLPYTANEDHSEVIVRAELDRVCAKADVPRVLPSMIRDTSLRAWMQADARVGEIVHGCRLGVIGHYVDPLDIISPVAPRVRVPDCFGACKEKQPEEALVASFRLLDPQAKDLVLMTAQRMGRA
jgi:hypothetical protein